MSIANQRAIERENRTPDVEVMGKTVKLGTLKLGGAVVPLGRAVVPLVELSGSTAWDGRKYRWCRDCLQNLDRGDFGAEMDDFGGKI